MRLIGIVLCAALLTAASAAIAQTQSGDMVVDVPFAFVVAGQSLPAGHYIVKSVDEKTVRIFNAQTTGLFVPTHSTLRNNSDGSKLVFHQYGNTYFLSAVWLTGNRTGRELFRSRAEHELAQRKTEMELAVVRPVK
jgi:hypothetical protein